MSTKTKAREMVLKHPGAVIAEPLSLNRVVGRVVEDFLLCPLRIVRCRYEHVKLHLSSLSLRRGRLPIEPSPRPIQKRTRPSQSDILGKVDRGFRALRSPDESPGAPEFIKKFRDRA